MIEIRSSTIEAGEDLVLAGHPVVFETETTIHTPTGDYIEVIDRHALDHTDMSDVTLKIEHIDRMVPLARTSRTMQLAIDEQGLYMVAHLAESRRDIYESVQRGDMTGLSFKFKVDEDGSSYDPRTNVRRVTDILRIYECSLTCSPAYPTASVEARSMMQDARARLHDTDQLLCHINELLLKLG